jgi:hypothetical protein
MDVMRERTLTEIYQLAHLLKSIKSFLAWRPYKERQ